MRQHGEKMDQLRKELVTKDKFQTGLKQSGEEFSRLRWELAVKTPSSIWPSKIRN